MKKNLLIVISLIVAVILTGCGKQLTIEQIKVLKKYNGTYSGSAISSSINSNNCKDAEIIMNVENGKYNGDVKTEWGYLLRIKGTIGMENNTELIEGFFTNPYRVGNYGTYKGSFTDANIVTGKWNDALGCSGTFELKK